MDACADLGKGKGSRDKDRDGANVVEDFDDVAAEVEKAEVAAVGKAGKDNVKALSKASLPSAVKDHPVVDAAAVATEAAAAAPVALPGAPPGAAAAAAAPGSTATARVVAACDDGTCGWAWACACSRQRSACTSRYSANTV